MIWVGVMPSCGGSTGIMSSLLHAAAARHRPAAAIHRKALGMILCFILQSFLELNKFYLPLFSRAVFAVADVGLVARYLDGAGAGAFLGGVGL